MFVHSMTCLIISEDNLLKMLSDVKNMRKEFQCSFFNCDLNEDRIVYLVSLIFHYYMNEEGKIKTVLNDVFPMRNTDGTGEATSM